MNIVRTPSNKSLTTRTWLPDLLDWVWAGVDLVAPPVCAGCGRTGSAWCEACRQETVFLPAACCPVCGGQAPSYEACRHCAEYAAGYTQARSYAAYRKPFRSVIVQLKHNRDRPLGSLVADLISEPLRELGWDPDLVVPVPLARARQAARGYNQVDLFGRPLAVQLGASYRPDAIVRVRETRSQVGLTGEERSHNLAGAFSADMALVAGRTVLLLDDVFTTGSTASACARVLFAVGAQQVFVYTLARAGGPDEEDPGPDELAPG